MIGNIHKSLYWKTMIILILNIRMALFLSNIHKSLYWKNHDIINIKYKIGIIFKQVCAAKPIWYQYLKIKITILFFFTANWC